VRILKEYGREGAGEGKGEEKGDGERQTENLQSALIPASLYYLYVQYIYFCTNVYIF